MAGGHAHAARVRPMRAPRALPFTPPQRLHASTCRSHAIVSSTSGPEYYVAIYSFVDKTQLEPGCTVLLHNKVRAARRSGRPA